MYLTILSIWLSIYLFVHPCPLLAMRALLLRVKGLQGVLDVLLGKGSGS